MKPWAILLLVMTGLVTTAAGPRDAQWLKVKEATDKGLPKTALEALEPIVAGALRDRAWDEAAKAIGRRIALETQIEGHQPEEAIARLQAELGRAPTELKPVFHALLAKAWWGYFRQNRWRILQRTSSNQEPGPDFRTWDLRQLFAAIDREFTQALADAPRLQSIPIATYGALAEPGTAPDAERPTLYDFLAREALEFYQAGDQGLARPEDAFVPGVDGPFLGVAEDFLRWQPVTSDTNSATLKGIRLYQDLLRFHQADVDPSAFLAADIDRFLFARVAAAAGPQRDERFLAGLRHISETWPRHELSARARYEMAAVLEQQGKRAEARNLATQAATDFPNSAWARQSRNLVRQIEAKELRITTERVWNAPWPSLKVQYRNLDKVYFRAVSADWDQFLNRRMPRPERLNRQQRLEFLRRPPSLEWSADLPPTADFQTRGQETPAPATLAPGFYLIFASHRADFSGDDNEVSMVEVWVSDLALVVRPHENLLEGFVLQAGSGEPVVGATVEAWYLAGNGERVLVGPATTDEAGTFSFNPPENDRGYLVRARKGGHQIATSDEIRVRTYQRPDRIESGFVLFTDRALYRPGQLVHYRGLAYRADFKTDAYETRGGANAIVVFRDVNDAEISRQAHRANEWGTFSGTFTTPRDRLPGRMSIAIEGNEGDRTWVQVEEYKRPKFQVTLDAPKAASRLNEPVQLEGRALAYTGAAVGRAAVTWRVTRRTVLPFWWGWNRGPSPPIGDEAQEIAHGTTETTPDGTFTVAFRALPDPATLETDEPTFHFAIHSDVTDIAGETRSAERLIHVGYTGLTAQLAADDWQTDDRPVAIVVRTQTLDDEPLAARGTLKIHRLKEPAGVRRPQLTYYFQLGPHVDNSDPSDPNRWELGDVVAEQSFQTTKDGIVTNRFELGVGLYRAMLSTEDSAGKKASARLPLRVLSPSAPRLALKIPTVVAAPTWEVEPGSEFSALWGTGYPEGRAFIEIEHRGRMIQRFWTAPGRTQQRVQVAVTEAMRGGFTLHVIQVRENREYVQSRHVSVPWSNKILDLTWETFRLKLEPGQAETWTAVVKLPKKGGSSDGADRAMAEMVATLYDASLDQYTPHEWPERFGFWPRHDTTAFHVFANSGLWFNTFNGSWRTSFEDVSLRYRSFPADLQFESMGPRFAMTANLMSRAVPASAAMESLALHDAAAGAGVATTKLASAGGGGGGVPENLGVPPPGQPDLSKVTARKNLNETAFFFPHLLTDSNGVIRLTFTMPEALTEWRFLGFAHDRQLRSGRLEGRTVTSRDIMVQPNPPRFLREGDQLEFTVKVSNQSDARQTGRVRLTLAFAIDDLSADEKLGNTTPEMDFDLPPRESRSYGWRLKVPDGCGFLSFKAVASTGRQSDGEEGLLPVLSRRVFLTESLPIWIRGPGAKHFQFERFETSIASPSLRPESITVQMASQPAWYAVLALPYLMEFPHECAEQVFNRLYANAVARKIAQSDPKIRRVFDLWRATPALESPLAKNEDLKSVMIAETPWLHAAQKEGDARRNLAVFFEPNRLSSETDRALHQLAELQLGNGGWPWFPGGPENKFITLYIAAGFGRLRQLGAEVSWDMALKALRHADSWMQERYDRIKEDKKLEDPHIDSTIALYLYGRSFFSQDLPIEAGNPQREAFDFWVRQAREHWLKLERLSQGHLALAFARLGNAAHADAQGTAEAIARSLKERSVASDEFGRSWRDSGTSGWWYRAPIEAQALMIEVFDVVAHDATAVDECRHWLLEQKRTQDWKTTKATADAVYALLLGGPSLLGSDALVEVEIAGRNITPTRGAGTPDRQAAPEPGTGFYEVRFAGSEITPKFGEIDVRKSDRGIAWGSVHWQYFEDLGNVTAFEGNPLKLQKGLFRRVNTAQGPELRAVEGSAKVGDELIVRIELHSDRDLEYVHLKDQRGSGTEPSNVLSGYRFQDGLGYYESTRDTASHFFIEYLPRGTYVFEYPLRVQHRGEYPAGVAEIQCLYAPEFNGHSESIVLQVN